MGPLATIDRYWQTLRWLKPVQFYGRLWFRAVRPRPDLSPAPPRRSPSGDWTPPARRGPSLVGPGVFHFLNQTGDLSDCGWDDPGRDKLWRYNQHYFDDLNAEGAPARTSWHVALVDHWVAHNPPGLGCGWEPYPTSLRIVNWIKWALSGHELDEAAVQSLAVQVRWLRRRLEWHLLGNHLFANAKALVFAGLWFEGPEARAWLQKGLQILDSQVPEQILPDGGQFELSPMYHALALEDVLDLTNINLCYRGTLSVALAARLDKFADLIGPMQSWLEAMSHPDGRVSFFNDAAFGVAPEKAELEAYATRLGFALPPPPPARTWLSKSGYARIGNADTVVIADLARVGPDYLPGHAHADSLSFEFSAQGRRLFVNSGVSTYAEGSDRAFQRGTSAHNTLTIDGLNSSDVWGGFRVGRRAVVIEAGVHHEDGRLSIVGAHDGYHRLMGSPIHRRSWTLDDSSLRIEDFVQGAAECSEIQVNYLLHPEVCPTQDNPASGTFRLPTGRILNWTTAAADVSLEPATWHPGFREAVRTVRIVLRAHSTTCSMHVNWKREN